MLNNRSKNRQAALGKDAVASTLIAFAKDKCSWTPWTGTTTELRVALGEFDDKADLPVKANMLSRRISEIIPALREEGVVITKDRVGHGSTRILQIAYSSVVGPDADVADDADEARSEIVGALSLVKGAADDADDADASLSREKKKKRREKGLV